MATSDDRIPDPGASTGNIPPAGVPGGIPPGSPGPAELEGYEPVPGTHGRGPAEAAHGRKEIGRSRVGNTWVALIVAALLGIVLLIFILQNSENADVEMLFWNFSLPLGVTILLSVIAGALVMALVGGVRIVQLRRAVHRE